MADTRVKKRESRRDHRLPSAFHIPRAPYLTEMPRRRSRSGPGASKEARARRKEKLRRPRVTSPDDDPRTQTRDPTTLPRDEIRAGAPGTRKQWCSPHPAPRVGVSAGQTEEEALRSSTRDRPGRGGRRAAGPSTPPHRGPSRSSRSSSNHGRLSQGRRSRSREPTPPQLMNFSIDDFIPYHGLIHVHQRTPFLSGMGAGGQCSPRGPGPENNVYAQPGGGTAG